MDVDLFAGVTVRDRDQALAWYEAFWGAEPSFLPNDTEAVWQLAEHAWMYIDVRPERAGHALHTIIVDDLDVRIARLAGHGIAPAEQETYDNGTRKVTFRDPDGNEIGLGEVPGGGAEATD